MLYLLPSEVFPPHSSLRNRFRIEAIIILENFWCSIGYNECNTVCISFIAILLHDEEEGSRSKLLGEKKTDSCRIKRVIASFPFASLETHLRRVFTVNGDAYVTRIRPSPPFVSFVPLPHYREKLYWVFEGTGCRPSISSAWLIVISRWSCCGENRGFYFYSLVNNRFGNDERVAQRIHGFEPSDGRYSFERLRIEY